MKEVINKIFYDNNFHVHNFSSEIFEDVKFQVNLNENSINFYIILFVDRIEENFLNDLVPELYHELKSLDNDYDERMDKNLSMLIVLRTDEIQERNIIKKTFEIEEDAYFFKKYVFTYTKEQADTLSNYFKTQKDNANGILNNIVNNKELFISFKDKPRDQSSTLYNLSSKLLIKLPFLSFERDEKQMENLSVLINNELKNNNLFENSEHWLGIPENITLKEERINRILKGLIEGDKNESI